MNIRRLALGGVLGLAVAAAGGFGLVQLLNRVEVDEATRPFLVKLVQDGGGEVVCGGIALAPSWVLTAGHCVEPDSTCALNGCSAVPAGTTTALQYTPILHRRYQSGGLARDYQHDLALLHIRAGATLPAHWTSDPVAVASVQPTDQLVSYGWGFWHAFAPRTLRRSLPLAIPVPTATPCEAAFTTQDVQNDEACAGHPSGAPCRFDSGGPVFVADVDSNTPTLISLVGVTSQANDFCINNDWAIFAAFDEEDLTWLQDTMGNVLPAEQAMSQSAVSPR